MRQEEFFRSFQEALTGEVSEGTIQENIAYYKNYIYQETQKGRSVDEVLDALGSPRLLAKTIISTANLEPNYKDETAYYRAYSNNRTYDSDNSGGSWEEAEEDHRSFKQKLKEFNMPQWLKGILSIIVIALCIGLAFAVISYMAPFIIFVICIIGIIRFIKNISGG